MVLFKRVFIFSLVFVLFSSCNEGTDLSSQIPKEVTGVGKIDLPRLKSKALSWDVLYEYIFSEDDGKERVDWAIDIDRPAFIYSSNESMTLLAPIKDETKFEKAIKSISSSSVLEENGFNYIREKGLFFGWKKDVAYVSNSLNFTNPVLESNDSLAYVLNAKHDFSFFYRGEDFLDAMANGEFVLDFEDGEIKSFLKADGTVYGLLENELGMDRAISIPEKEYLGLVGARVNPRIAKDVLKMSLPLLQQNGLLFAEQLNALVPHLSGEIQMGLGKERIKKDVAEAQLCLGVKNKEAIKYIVDSTWSKDSNTGFYSDSENFQFVGLYDDKVVFSNKLIKALSFKKGDNLIKLDVYKDLLKGDLLAFAEMRFGRNAIENFPLRELSFNLTKTQDNNLESRLNLKFLNADKNSLLSLMDYITSLSEEDEI